jgi:hypothetical protein
MPHPPSRTHSVRGRDLTSETVVREGRNGCQKAAVARAWQNPRPEGRGLAYGSGSLGQAESATYGVNVKSVVGRTGRL